MPYAANGKVATDPFPGSVSITDEQYAAAIDGVIKGLVITIDGGFSLKEPQGSESPGDPEDPPQQSLDQIKGQMKELIDSAAELERLKYITPGAGQAMTYQAKASEARSFLASTSPDPSDFPMLSAEVGITADDIASVAQVVTAAYARWQIIGAAIEGARLGGKAAIDAATSEADAHVAFGAVQWPRP